MNDRDRLKINKIEQKLNKKMAVRSAQPTDNEIIISYLLHHIDYLNKVIRNLQPKR